MWTAHSLPLFFILSSQPVGVPTFIFTRGCAIIVYIVDKATWYFMVSPCIITMVLEFYVLVLLFVLIFVHWKIFIDLLVILFIMFFLVISTTTTTVNSILTTLWNKRTKFPVSLETDTSSLL